MLYLSVNIDLFTRNIQLCYCQIDDVWINPLDIFLGWCIWRLPRLFIFPYKFFLGLVVCFSVKGRADCCAGIDKKTKEGKNQKNES